jgi:hypothetical protein
MRPTPVALALLFSGLLGCASGGHPASSAAPSPEAKSGAPASDPNRLTPAEIQAADLPTAYDLVDRLRRPWLRKDAVTGGDVVVYRDEQNIGDAEKLRDIPSIDVGGMEYLNNGQATGRWGSDIKGSVIVITRRR